jgi:hypothetical protein
MPTFTLAGDESGDVSMSFGRGASRNFVLTMIATQHPDELRHDLEVVRKDANLARNYEFKFHSLTSSRLRQEVFMALRQMDFSIWAVIADKTSLPTSFQKMSRTDFYLYFVAELLSTIPAPILEKSTLILDEFGSPTSIRAGLKRMLLLRGVSASFKRLTISRSRSEPLIQIADLVAGSILRRDTHNESGAYDFIAGKIRHLSEIG